MTTGMQIGETTRDRADFCRCFKTGAAVFLHDDGIVAHSTYRNDRPIDLPDRQLRAKGGYRCHSSDHHLNPSINVLQPSASSLISSKTPSAAKWCGNSQSGRAFIPLTNEATAFLRSSRSR